MSSRICKEKNISVVIQMQTYFLRILTLRAHLHLFNTTDLLFGNKTFFYVSFTYGLVFVMRVFQFKRMSCCTGEVVLNHLKVHVSVLVLFFSFFFFPFLFSFFMFCFVLFCFLCLLLFFFFCRGVFWALRGLAAKILGWPYLVCSLIVSWPSRVLLCALSSFSLVFYFLSTWLCF